MTAFNIAIVIISYVTIVILIFFLRRDNARIPRKKLITGAVITGVLFAGGFPFWEMRLGDNIQTVDLYILLEFIVVFPVSFVLYPKKVNKNIFFISTTTPLLVVGHGLGNLTEMTIQADKPVGRIYNLFVMTLCFAVILAGIFWLARIRFPGLYESEHPKLWRRLWIITLMMGFAQLSAGNIFSGETFNAVGIIPSRFMCLAGMTAILFVAGLAKAQAEESAEAEARAAAAEKTVREKEEAYAAIVAKADETSRRRHDRRQMFAAIGIMNTQSFEQSSEQSSEYELIKYCNEILSETACKAEQSCEQSSEQSSEQGNEQSSEYELIKNRNEILTEAASESEVLI
jgi:hypothetical protein